MYHALLTNRYLTSRIIPFIAVAAVAMCVALVIIVVSVMTGFLNMVKSSGRTLMGDVVVSYPVSGIPHYEKLIEMIEELPEAEVATPVVDSFCLLKMPYPDEENRQTEMVQFWGIEPASFAAVTGFGDSLHWRELSDEHWARLVGDVVKKHWESIHDGLDDDQRFSLLRWFRDGPGAIANPDMSDEELRQILAQSQSIPWEVVYRRLRFQIDVLENLLGPERWQQILAYDQRLIIKNQILEDGLTMTRGPNRDPAMVLGLHVSEANLRQQDGSYDTYNGRWFMPGFEVTLTTMPVRSGLADPESYIFPVANEFQSGVFLIDDTRVMIPLAEAQRLTKLDEAKIVDDFDPDQVVGVDPARATMVLVRAVEGVTPDHLRDLVNEVYKNFSDALFLDPEVKVKPPSFNVGIMTWEQQQAQFIGPVEKERELMRTLFSLVYIVCAGLVLAIFWAIVYEKTRDIGILRSVGASRIGISWIFLRYGLIVGTLGAIFGFGLGSLIVININIIHNAMGNPPKWLAYVLGTMTLISLGLTLWKMTSGKLLPPVLSALVFFVLLLMTSGVAFLIKIGGAIIWNPEIYYFTVIPNEVDLGSAYFTMAGAVLFSLVGAFLPAAKAADVDPVKALHYE
ncbi:MAG: hypothetical protein O7G85_08075 [Planctomycetota bacterium]|nr:hypothetical protein [Planctomycetota bacterium]